MENFNPDPCIDLWWQAKTQRPDQKKRKRYKKRTGQNVESENESDNVCWMTGIIGWMILKYDLCTVRHTAYIVY